MGRNWIPIRRSRPAEFRIVSFTQVSSPRGLYNLWTIWGTNCIFLFFLRRKKRGATTEKPLRPPGGLDSSRIIGKTECAALRCKRRPSPPPGRRSARVERLAPKRARNRALLGAVPKNEPDRRTTRRIRARPTHIQRSRVGKQDASVATPKCAQHYGRRSSNRSNENRPAAGLKTRLSPSTFARKAGYAWPRCKGGGSPGPATSRSPR
jgi:hypothetical protein